MSTNTEIILKALISKNVSAADLTRHQRKSIVIFLLERGKYHYSEISNLVGLVPSRISQINKQRTKNYVHLIDELEIKSLAGKHIQEAERAMIELKKKGEDRQAWSVHRELIQDLQAMGYINKEPVKLDISLEDKAKSWEEMFGINLNKPKIVNELPQGINASNN